MALRTKTQEPLLNSSSADRSRYTGTKTRHISFYLYKNFSGAVEPAVPVTYYISSTGSSKVATQTNTTLNLARRSTTSCYSATTKVKHFQKTLTTLGATGKKKKKSLWLWAALKYSSTSKLGGRRAFPTANHSERRSGCCNQWSGSLTLHPLMKK